MSYPSHAGCRSMRHSIRPCDQFAGGRCRTQETNYKFQLERCFWRHFWPALTPLCSLKVPWLS
jgi:hypothetical protein